MLNTGIWDCHSGAVILCLQFHKKDTTRLRRVESSVHILEHVSVRITFDTLGFHCGIVTKYFGGWMYA
jgi:hypothetical protein